MQGIRPALVGLAGAVAAVALAFAAPTPQRETPRLTIVVGPVLAVAALAPTGLAVALRWAGPTRSAAQETGAAHVA